MHDFRTMMQLLMAVGQIVDQRIAEMVFKIVVSFVMMRML
jgi:hypothetical protein